MKKTIALILAVVMLMSSACINVFATDSDCIIRVKNATAMPGNTFSVDITVENNPGIQGATLVLTWDSGLTLTENPENGEAFSALEPTFSKNLSSP